MNKTLRSLILGSLGAAVIAVPAVVGYQAGERDGERRVAEESELSIRATGEGALEATLTTPFNLQTKTTEFYCGTSTERGYDCSRK